MRRYRGSGLLRRYGGTAQQAETQTERDVAQQPSFPAPDEREFVPGEVIVGLEEDATQADLAAINRQTDARTEEDLPRSDVNLLDLPPDLGMGEGDVAHVSRAEQRQHGGTRLRRSTTPSPTAPRSATTRGGTWAPRTEV